MPAVKRYKSTRYANPPKGAKIEKARNGILECVAGDRIYTLHPTKGWRNRSLIDRTPTRASHPLAQFFHKMGITRGVA